MTHSINDDLQRVIQLIPGTAETPHQHPSFATLLEKKIRRFFDQTHGLFELGMDDHGHCSALAYSPADARRVCHIRNWMRQLDMTPQIDAVGSLFGIWKGTQPEAKRLLLISHLDTVPHAGAYDGVLGIVLPLLLIELYQELNLRFTHSLEVRVCPAEESPGITATFGSKLLTGHYPFTALNTMSLAWQPDTTVLAAINRFHHQYVSQPDVRLTPTSLVAAQLKPETYAAALEFHAEMFWSLRDRANRAGSPPHLGVMTGVGGHIRQTLSFTTPAPHPPTTGAVSQALALTITGKPGHSGATPMRCEYRYDAAVKMAEAIMYMDLKFRDTVDICDFRIHHPSITSIPAQVTLELILRADTTESLGTRMQTLQEMVSSYPAVITPLDRLDKPPIHPLLIKAMATTIYKTDRSAGHAPPDGEIRGTITRVDIHSPRRLSLFCDIRGNSLTAMTAISEKITQPADLPEGVQQTITPLSKNQPTHFQPELTRAVSGCLRQLLGEHRLWTDSMSIPGHDIGNLSAAGIPCGLVFVESSCGHHKEESISEGAISVALSGLIALIQQLDKAGSVP